MALRIRVADADDIPAGDENGWSDPYVKVTVVTEEKSYLFKTSTKKKTLTPVWDEEFRVDTKAWKSIEFVLMDYDVMSKDDFLGSGRIEVSKTELTRWPTNFNFKMGDGKLRVIMSFAPPNGKDPYFTKFNGTLTMKIVEAKGLLDTNIVAKQNPYVYMTFCGTTKRTAVHKKGGINPSWNETVQWDIKDCGNEPDEHIVLKVYDKEMIKDDFLGETHLPLSLLTSHQNKRIWWRLFQDRKRNFYKGEILLDIEWNGTGGYPKTKPLPRAADGVISAFVGGYERMLDVTMLCRPNVLKGGKLVIPEHSDWPFMFACDPHPFLKKKLEVHCIVKGKEKTLTVEEEDKAISIPVGDYGGWKSDVKRIQSVSQSNLEKLEYAKMRKEDEVEKERAKYKTKLKEMDLDSRKIKKIREYVLFINKFLPKEDQDTAFGAVEALEDKLRSKRSIAERYHERQMDLIDREFLDAEREYA